MVVGVVAGVSALASAEAASPLATSSLRILGRLVSSPLFGGRNGR
jgi:hypothetical protein